MPQNNNNKNILVTGATRGIGKAIAERLLTDGYSVILHGREQTDVEAVAKQLRELGSVIPIAFDLRERTEILGAFTSWETPLYGVIHNAGMGGSHFLQDTNEDPWDDMVKTNLDGVYFLTKAVLPFLQDQGRIVNISSQLGQEGRTGYSAYCASKFGLIGLTKCWAKELGARGITVNAVCPGWVRTEMVETELETWAKQEGKTKEQVYQEICQPLELKRFTEMSEVASLVAYLVSVEAGGITGRDWLMNTVWNQR